MTDQNWSLVIEELEAAKKKHPHFVDRIFWLPASTLSADEDLEMMRARLADTIAGGRCNVGALLRCELEEAKNAYAHGDLAHARQELAQCAAVCIRAMEYIEDKINKETNK